MLSKHEALRFGRHRVAPISQRYPVPANDMAVGGAQIAVSYQERDDGIYRGADTPGRVGHRAGDPTAPVRSDSHCAESIRITRG
jgi:hypothetical protein